MVLSSHSTSAPSRAPRRINDAHYCCTTRCGSSTEWRIHRTWRNLIDAAVRHRIALLWMMALMMVLLWLHMDDGASRGTRNKGSDYVAAVLHMDDGLLEAQETEALMILSRSCGCTC